MESKRIKIEVPEEVLQKTTKCNKNFKCLLEDANLCRIICCLGQDINFVKCLGDKACPYLEPHKKTELCTCPVRNEIYRRYQI
ncbi:MAG: hypothetical protein HZB30_08845 [Nitrospirae bacterium]|nr:hypothetical protein [Nitrospirota bacterium]